MLPGDGEVTGLLSLMLLTDARRPARIDGTGALVPLAAQDRAAWNHDTIADGIELVTAALSSSTARSVPDPGRDRGGAQRST